MGVVGVFIALTEEKVGWGDNSEVFFPLSFYI